MAPQQVCAAFLAFAAQGLVPADALTVVWPYAAADLESDDDTILICKSVAPGWHASFRRSAPHDGGYRKALVTLIKRGELATLSRSPALFTRADVLADGMSAITEACCTGSLQVLRWLKATYDLRPEDLFSDISRGCESVVISLSESGDIGAALCLGEVFDLGPELAGDHTAVALGQACTHGNLGVARWLKATFRLTIDDVRFEMEYHCLRQLCRYNYFEMAKWLADAFELTPYDGRICDNYPLLCACSNGNLEMVQWLVEAFGLGLADVQGSRVLSAMAAEGNLRVVKWLVRHFAIGASEGALEALITACQYEQHDVAKWLASGFVREGDGEWTRPSNPDRQPVAPVRCGNGWTYTTNW